MPLLRHRRTSADQAGLARSGRLRNVTGTLIAPSRPGSLPTAMPTARWVVVDDIVTTGATLREAARALLVAGFPVAAGAAVAATPVRGSGVGPSLGDTPLSTASGGGYVTDPAEQRRSRNGPGGPIYTAGHRR